MLTFKKKYCGRAGNKSGEQCPPAGYAPVIHNQKVRQKFDTTKIQRLKFNFFFNIAYNREF